MFVVGSLFDKSSGAVISNGVRILFSISNMLNILWIILWQNSMLWASLLVMVLLSISLLSIYLEVDAIMSGKGLRKLMIYRLPFSVFISWIMAATTANIAIYLSSINWGPAGLLEEVSAVIVGGWTQEARFRFPARSAVGLHGN